MTDIEKNRLEDFYKVLTFHIVDKINYYFKGNVDTFTKVSAAYKAFIACKNKKMKYDKQKIHKIYDAIIKFNQCGMNSQTVLHILGKDPETGKYLKRSLIEEDARIMKVNNGTIVMNQNIKNNRYDIVGKEKRRFQYSAKYLIKDIAFLKSIFEDAELLEKVRDAGSDYYTDRQRRLIFTQILKKKNGYHYKTSAELGTEFDEKEPTEEELNMLIDDIDII